jgi:hypothetical protein
LSIAIASEHGERTSQQQRLARSVEMCFSRHRRTVSIYCKCARFKGSSDKKISLIFCLKKKKKDGTTATVLLIDDGILYHANVGDGEGFLRWKDGRIQPVTKAHKGWKMYFCFLFVVKTKIIQLVIGMRLPELKNWRSERKLVCCSIWEQGEWPYRILTAIICEYRDRLETGLKTNVILSCVGEVLKWLLF